MFEIGNRFYQNRAICLNMPLICVLKLPPLFPKSAYYFFLMLFCLLKREVVTLFN